MPVQNNSKALERILRERKGAPSAELVDKGANPLATMGLGAKKEVKSSFLVKESVYEGLVFINGSDFTGLVPKESKTAVVEDSLQTPRVGYILRRIHGVEVSFRGLAPAVGTDVTFFVYSKTGDKWFLRCK